MGWSGGVFSRARNWVNDAAAAIGIEAVKHDEEDDNLAAGINACIAKDGSNSDVKSAATEVVINDDGGDIDFRVESDAQASTLFVNGQNGGVYINSDETVETNIDALIVGEPCLQLKGNSSGYVTIVNEVISSLTSILEVNALTLDPGILAPATLRTDYYGGYDTAGNFHTYLTITTNLEVKVDGAEEVSYRISGINNGTLGLVLNVEGDNIRLGNTDFGTNNSATDGFMYIPVMDGAPTGTAASVGNRRSGAMVFDDTNDRLYIWSETSAGWVSVALT